ncbi:MAG: type I restriction enzyme HsdR N-terminal domain-containing protein [Crocinitomicaceae bacterium]|nr:type I restriction enzyme HsdR N-terminal domain-containing protein [Crocinitomicaceae bacterium]
MDKPIKLNLPIAKLKLYEKNNITYVKCLIRNKKIILTPEEWVRQHLISYLDSNFNYSKSRMAVEYELKYNKLSKRADIVFFDKKLMPYLLVECKAPEVKLDKNVLHQIVTYNAKLNAPFLLISNGIEHYIFEVSNGEIKPINTLIKQ